MAIVAFEPAKFIDRYPEFECTSLDLLQSYFSEAGMYCDNTDNSPVRDIAQRTYFLWLLTAHIATLTGKNGTQPVPVGRINEVKEGSVSVSMDYFKLTPGTGPWFQQTQYGAAYWQASSAYRGFKYKIRQTIPW